MTQRVVARRLRIDRQDLVKEIAGPLFSGPPAIAQMIHSPNH